MQGQQTQNQSAKGGDFKPRDMMEQTRQKVEQQIKSLEQRVESSGTPQDYETLKADLKTLREDLTQLLAGVKESASQTAQGIAHDLKDSGEQVGAKVLDAIGHAKDKGAELTDQLEGTVRERPITSLLVAFGAGLVLSRMMK